MMRGRGGWRTWLLAIACMAALSACRDLGLDDRNLPLAEAENRPFRYAVYQPMADNPPLAMGGRHWVRMPPVEQVPARLLVPVGNVEGTVLYARRGDEAPYSRLYSPVGPNRWLPYARLN